MLLEHIVKLDEYQEMKQELETFGEVLAEAYGLILEAVSMPDVKGDESFGELENLLGDAILRFTAAKKGLGIVNKLKNPEERKEHKKRIMGNMNKLRGLMQRLDKKLKSMGSLNESVSEEALTEGKAEFKQFDQLAQKVWAAKDVAGKQQVLNQMVDSFRFKDKQEKFRAKVKAETNPTKLDKLAADIMQVGHGDKVIK